METSPVFVVSPGSLIHLLASDSRQRQEEANNCVNSDLTNGGWLTLTHHPLHISNGKWSKEILEFQDNCTNVHT